MLKSFYHFILLCLLTFHFIISYKYYIFTVKVSAMKTFPFIGILLFLALNSCARIHVKGFCQFIPKQVETWEARDKDEFYNRNTLSEYIDGGAELYLAYNFQEVFVRRYAGPADTEIILDIYDMGLSNDAFGIFSVEREDEDLGIGQDSEYGGDLLRFWKGRFFISILTTGDEQKAKPAMIQLAREVDRLLEKEGLKPALLNSLPGKGLDGKGLKFFHTAAILNRQYFIAENNILLLDKHTDCVLGKYSQNNDSAFVLIIQYQNKELAKTAYRTFLASYMPEAEGTGIVRLENKTWTLIKIDGDFLILVLEATQKDFGMNLMARVNLRE